MLAGQTAALAAVIWWYGVSLTHLLNLASDGVVATPDHLHIDPRYRCWCWL